MVPTGPDRTSLGPSAQWFQDADRYSRRNAIVELRTKIVRQVLGDLEGARIIDLGSGDGTLSLQYAGVAREIALVDFSAPMLGAARAKAPKSTTSIAFHQVDLTDGAALDLSPADVVMCIGVLAHVPDPAAVIAAATRLVAPGGRLLVQITDAGQRMGDLALRFDNLFRSVRHYRLTRTTAADIIGAAAGHGFVLASSLRHAPAVSGLRLLPTRLQRLLLEALQRGDWSAPFRTEVLLLFDKEQLTTR